jgi:hypothetical protein
LDVVTTLVNLLTDGSARCFSPCTEGRRWSVPVQDAGDVADAGLRFPTIGGQALAAVRELGA